MKFFTWAAAIYLLILSLGQVGCGAMGLESSASGTTLTEATNLVPNAVNAGQSSFNLHVYGLNFTTGSNILWNGAAMATTQISPQELMTQVSSQAVAKASIVAVGVRNKTSGSVTKTLSLTIAGPLQITTTQLPAGEAGVPYSAPVSVVGGTTPTQWSVAAGSLPSGMTMNSQTGMISGTPGSSGTFDFTDYVTDSLSSSAKMDLSISITPAGTSPTQSTSSNTQFYGSGLGADDLANTTVGQYGDIVSYRFRAKHSGVLQQALIYLIPDHPGYAAGTGGTIQVTLQTDDGTTAHNPGTTVLTSYVISNILSLPSPARYFYTMKFAPPPKLTAGQLYHMVFKNVDASPTTNFLSVDDLYHKNVTTPGQPTISDIDCAVLLSQDGEAWSQRKSFTPIYQLDFQNGVTEGMGYMEAWVPQIISGTNAIRETFTVSGSQVNVSSASIRLARINGNDPLTVRLENADGTLIEQGSIPATAIVLSSATSPVNGWVTYPFSTTYTLIPGQTYRLDFEATATSAYQAFPIRKGSAEGFMSTTFFPDGYAEFKQDGGSWFGWTQWGQTNRTDGDLQFYFTLAP